MQEEAMTLKDFSCRLAGGDMAETVDHYTPESAAEEYAASIHEEMGRPAIVALNVHVTDPDGNPHEYIVAIETSHDYVAQRL